jgi:hypothetical protein
MSDRTPYTYFILHIPTGLKYYGSKYGKGANPELFWKPGGYFTSSLKVKELLTEYGVNSFRAEVRKVFKSPDRALSYEYRFLKKVNALNKEDWLNENLGGEKFRNVGPASDKALLSQKMKKQTPEGNAKRSASLTGRVISEETKKKMSAAQLNRPKDKEDIRRDKIRAKAIGRPHSNTTKSKLSEIVSRTRWVNNGVNQKKVNASELTNYLELGWKTGRILQIVSCPYCGATGVKHNIVRRHFEKCKLKGK